MTCAEPRRRRTARACLLAAGSLLFGATAAPVHAGTTDPLVQVSGPSPFAECTADFINFQNGRVFVGAEVEPWVAVNPANPRNIVATWQQDRWSNGGARGLAVGTSFDGGLTWRTVPIPGLTPCTGGPFFRASDPWVAFGPTGDLFHISLALGGGPGRNSAIVVSKSVDGGQTWDPPVILAADDQPLFHDKEAITADPADPSLVYAVWDRIDFVRDIGPAVFSRTTDGGRTWEAPRVIHDPGPGGQTIANQILVLPNGALVDFFTEIVPGGSVFLSLKRSDDKGLTWQPGGGSIRAQAIIPQSAITPDGTAPLRDGAILFDVAADPVTGALYAVWQDARFSGFEGPAIAFTMSVDGGLSWTAPVRVNQTPAGLDPFKRQAFLPSIEVSANGTVGITYYDFRFDDPEPAGATDHWFIWCHPQASDCTNPARWREEIRLTDASFDIEHAPFVGGRFLGDYLGLASAGRDFVAVFIQPHAADPASAFFRRIRLDGTVDPLDAGRWRHEVRALLDGKGRPFETADSLAAFLDDIHVLYDVFDDVRGLLGLRSTLEPKPRPTRRDMVRVQLMALLLNLTSFRLPPYTEVRDGQTVTGAIREILGILESPSSTGKDLEAAKHLAQELNHGHLPLKP
jgi:hypothetical protein